MSTVVAEHGPPIHVVGLGMAGAAPSDPSARAALAGATTVIGSERQLGAIATGRARRLTYPSPFRTLPALIARHDDGPLCLLASGDPLFHGVGGWAIAHLPRARLRFHPAPSSVQFACARLGLRTDAVTTVTLHGRPLTRLRSRLRAGRHYACLGDADASPPAIARELVAAGFGRSPVWVAERLGGEGERLTTTDAGALAGETNGFDALHVTLFRTEGPGGALPEFPGLPDTAFATGESPGRGLITKREVRLAVLADLAPRAGDTGWDIGAGCGGVAVEWARWNPRGHVHAIERDARRLDHLCSNRERYGLDANLHPVHGSAPDALAGLPDPDAVFIGGHDGALAELIDIAVDRLRPGGRLVASAVTEHARAVLVAAAERHGGRLTEIAVARGERLAGATVMRPQLPVRLYSLGGPA